MFVFSVNNLLPVTVNLSPSSLFTWKLPGNKLLKFSDYLRSFKTFSEFFIRFSKVRKWMRMVPMTRIKFRREFKKRFLLKIHLFQKKSCPSLQKIQKFKKSAFERIRSVPQMKFIIVSDSSERKGKILKIQKIFKKRGELPRISKLLLNIHSAPRLVPFSHSPPFFVLNCSPIVLSLPPFAIS